MGLNPKDLIMAPSSRVVIMPFWSRSNNEKASLYSKWMANVYWHHDSTNDLKADFHTLKTIFPIVTYLCLIPVKSVLNIILMKSQKLHWSYTPLFEFLQCFDWLRAAASCREFIWRKGRIFGLQPRDKVAMLGVNKIQFFHKKFKWKWSLVPRGKTCFCSWPSTWPPWRHVQTSNL